MVCVSSSLQRDFGGLIKYFPLGNAADAFLVALGIVLHPDTTLTAKREWILRKLKLYIANPCPGDRRERRVYHLTLHVTTGQIVDEVQVPFLMVVLYAAPLLVGFGQCEKGG